MKKSLVASLLLAAVAFPASAEWENPKAVIPPQAHQNRISGGESFPPLPLPATPIRRTERKREPAPPALVGKINLNTMKDGKAASYPSVTIDIENLMNWTNAQLKLRYRYIDTDLTKFSYSPTELPVLYITGWTKLPDLSEKVKQKLRDYLLAGGTFVVHSNCGRPEFNESFEKLQAELFPDRPLAAIPTDHPLYSCLNKINSMKVRKNKDQMKETLPYLKGMSIGCRLAVIYSPVDVSWGWDVANKPIDGGVLYDQNDSLKLGANMLTYVLANYEYARAFEITKIYHQADIATRDQLVVAQIKHNGDWDPTPHGLPNLLKFIDTNSTLNVQFKRQTMTLEDEAVLKQPILFMTGLREFTLNDKEKAQLSKYLTAGGLLFADAAMGMDSFDKSFKKMVEQVLPGSTLETLPPEHPIYGNVFKLKEVKYSPLVTQVEPNLKQPLLQAVIKDGVPVILYSPKSLSNGWEQLPNPYAKAYSDEDALKLGTNILVYSMTH